MRVEYFDVAEPATRQEYGDVVAAAQAHHLPYPLVAIDDDFRFAGRIDYYLIAKEIEKLREEAGLKT